MNLGRRNIQIPPSNIQRSSKIQHPRAKSVHGPNARLKIEEAFPSHSPIQFSAEASPAAPEEERAKYWLAGESEG
jgi:hypothetical protein